LVFALLAPILAGCTHTTETNAPFLTSEPVPTAFVSGVAATGAPVAGAIVTLKDRAGQSRTTTTSSSGAYTVDVTGLTPPFLVRVQTPSGSLYSVSADTLSSTTINVHPYSDLLVRWWYGVQNQSADSAFANPVVLPAPDPASVSLGSVLISQTVLLWLNKAGLDTSQFNLISSPFAANGSGFDAALRETTVNLETRRLTITDGTVTQTTTFAYDPAAAAVSIDSTTVSPSGSSTNHLSRVMPFQTAARAAVDSINATVSGLTAVINSKLDQLTGPDIMPFLTPGLLNDGLNQTDYATSLSRSFRVIPGATYGLELAGIDSLDLSQGRALLRFNSIITFSGQTLRSPFLNLTFERVGATWLIGGNQRLGNFSISFGSQISFIPGHSGPGVPGTSLAAQALVPKGSVSAVTVTGGGIWNALPLPPSIPSLGSDRFRVALTLPAGTLIPAGTPFTFTVTPASGPAVSYTITSPVLSNEPVSITSPTSSTPLIPGQPLLVSWRLPATFPVSSIFLSGIVNSLATGCDAPLQSGLLSTDATSTTLLIPSTCNGNAVTEVVITMNVSGVNGESAAAGFVLDTILGGSL
jgi:hypothetical protein